MIIFGAILMFVGFVLCLTIIGAFLGVPIMILGMIFFVAGFLGRRKTIITNVVQVTNAPSPPAPLSPARAPEFAQPSLGLSSAPQFAPSNSQAPLLERSGLRVPSAAQICSSCNSQNDSGSRFCNNCGTPLSTPAT
jgi:hypothetical protein